MLLNKNKIQCLKASNGTEAVILFEKDRLKRCCKVRIQLIFMNLMKDGINAVKQIIDILRKEQAIMTPIESQNMVKLPAEIAREMGVAIAAVSGCIDSTNLK